MKDFVLKHAEHMARKAEKAPTPRQRAYRRVLSERLAGPGSFKAKANMLTTTPVKKAMRRTGNDVSPEKVDVETPLLVAESTK